MIGGLDCAATAEFADTPGTITSKGVRTMTISIRRTVLTAGAVVLLGLAAIGLVQAMSSASGATAQPLAAVPVAAIPATTAAGATDATEAVLTSQLDAILAADQTAAGRTGARADPAAAPGLRRLRLGRHLVHATIVLDLPEKGLTTIQVDHGTITTVSATSLAIAETGDTSVTVTLGDETRVRRDGEKAKIADIEKGDEVFVMSKVESGGTVAYLVIVPKK
jgi:hypothetical protein